jgi:hypothetical protein
MTKTIIAAGLFAATTLAVPAWAAPEVLAPALADADTSLAAYQAEFRQRMMAADADHDGRISQAELTAAREAMRKERNDRTEADRPERSGRRGDPARMFGMLDTNGDGFLDAAELDAMSARRFARMDANGDGKITAEERESGRGQWRRRMGGQGGGWGGNGGGWGQGDGDQSGGGFGGQPDE